MGANAAQGITNWGFKLLLLSICIALLPESPFSAYVSLIDEIPFLAYLNWFVPIDGIFLVMQTWLQVVLAYCGYVYAHRYVGLVKGGGD